ncbi:MAG: hypothetical protein M3Y27_10765, partial [Acidobacteriota bacterium]|nr:hypothetical protein [Acidobacteriota bacterium]
MANEAPDPGGSSPSYCTSASGTWVTGGLGSTDNGGSGGTGAQQPLTLYSDYIHGSACITGDLGKYDVTGSWALENGAWQMDTGVIAIQIVSCATNLVVWPLGKRTWEYETHSSDTTGTTDQWVSLPSGSYAVRIWGYGAVEKGLVTWNFAGANSPGDRNFRGISACSNGGTASFPANFGGATEADGSGNPISGSGNPVPPPVPPPVHKATP